MPITVEFFGIARQRAGIARMDVEACNIGEALDAIAEQLPHWADTCLREGRLKPTLLANVNTRRFVADRHHPLQDGDHLLILSADVGG
jgi:molybdopterin converting factor small subunit